MAKGHSVSTLCASATVLTLGSALQVVVSIPPLLVLTLAVLVMAGSLRPDIDHSESTATHVWSLLSLAESVLWRLVARGYYSRTRTGDDPLEKDPHRTLTHTPFPGCLLLGAWDVLWMTGEPFRGLALFLGASYPQIGSQASFWALVGSMLAVGMAAGLALAPWGHTARLWGLLLGAVLAALLWRSSASPGPAGVDLAAVLAGPGLWPYALALWGAASFGCLCHVFGDCVTEGGAPLQHPRVVRWRDVKVSRRKGGDQVQLTEYSGRWVNVGPPRWMRFPTGGWREKGFLVLLVIGTGWLMWRTYVLGLPLFG